MPTELISLDHLDVALDGARTSVLDCAPCGRLPLCSTCGQRTVSVHWRPKVRTIIQCSIRHVKLIRGVYVPVAILRRAVRMGQHVWLLLATVITELLVILKWSRGLFPEPLPRHVRWGWSVGAALLVLYPTVRVRIYQFDQFGQWRDVVLMF